jgi:hypothetical protein
MGIEKMQTAAVSRRQQQRRCQNIVKMPFHSKAPHFENCFAMTANTN